MATESMRAPALARPPGGHLATVKAVLRTVARGVFLLIAAFLLMALRDETAVHVNLLYLALALAAIYLAMGSEFRVWAAYVSAFVLFSQLRGWADGIGAPVQYEYAIKMEEALFLGTLPTVWLQERFYTFAQLGILETFTIGVYLSYFFLPHMLAFALWKWDRERFKTYAFAFMATLYVGVLTCAVLPTAPPWLAGQLGYIPHVYQVFPDIAGEVTPGAYENAYEVAGANPVAAMPSLHAAIPFLMAIALWKYQWGRWAGGFYAAAMLFAIVYLGEHYAVDGLIGWGVAAACWVGVTVALRRWNARKREESGLQAGASEGVSDVATGNVGYGRVTER